MKKNETKKVGGKATPNGPNKNNSQTDFKEIE